MILKSITPNNFGPFLGGSTLEFAPEVTVLTGPNDAGKSLVLRAIELLCTEQSATEDEICRSRLGEFKGKWQEDNEVYCDADFELSPLALKLGTFPGNIKPGCVIGLRMNLAKPGRPYGIKKISDGNVRQITHLDINSWPSLICLPLVHRLRRVIDIQTPNPTEDQFIRLALGEQFSPEQHLNLLEANRDFRISEAEETLNSLLKTILPRGLKLRFKLREHNKPNLIGITLIDDVRGHTPISSRGSGVQSIAAAMGALLRINVEKEHSIILFDEPETCLHADAQHMLRRVLEDLAEKPTVQVVYATHSPAMINTLRPKSIRLVQRQLVNDKPTSIFINNTVSDNYALVRSSLGLSPADSLLYAPITIIIEGATEAICLPEILRKLGAADILSKDALNQLLPQTHLLDGQGSSYRYLCQLAKSQGAFPIIFLDGDKDNEAKESERDYPGVPVITLDSEQEFEDLVSKETYFKALASVLKNESGAMTLEAFREWEEAKSIKPTPMFSKRVERWLFETFQIRKFRKAVVMHRAVRMAEASEINAKPFRRLLEAMEEVGKLL